MNVAKWKDVWSRFAVLLLLPLRRIVFSPGTLVGHLHLTRTSRVLEVGPGPGFFSIDVARAIPEGRLELVDIKIEMLQKARGLRVSRGFLASFRREAKNQDPTAASPQLEPTAHGQYAPQLEPHVRLRELEAVKE